MKALFLLTVICSGLWTTFHYLYHEAFMNHFVKHVSNGCQVAIMTWDLIFQTLLAVLSLKAISESSPLINFYSLFNLPHRKVSHNLQYLFICAAIVSGLIHNAGLSVAQKGIQYSRFWSSLCLAAFFASAASVEVPDFALRLIFFSRIVEIFLLLTRWINIYKSSSSTYFWLFTFMVSVYFLIWFFTFCYIVPFHFIEPALHLGADETDIFFLLVMNASLLIFCVGEFFGSPAFQLSVEAIFSWKIDYDLFNFQSSQFTPAYFLTLSTLSQQLGEEKRSPQRVLSKKEESGRNSQNKQINSVALVKTVKCYLTMKRRLKNIRESKLNNQEDNVGDGSNSDGKESPGTEETS